MTIALQGEWGSGKTSLMYKLQDELCGPTGPYESVWINTWEYSLMSDSSEALLKIVAKMAAETETNTVRSKARNIICKLAKSTAKTVLGATTEDTGIVDTISDMFEADGESSIGRLQAELKNNIDKRFISSNKNGIIFFIDDLDRLNPEVAVELLELLKNIFTLDRCIFILAIDYDVVVKGLKSKFGELTDENEREFRSFFDKIIQVPFAMPISNYKPESLIVSSLKTISYIDDQDAKDSVFMSDKMTATRMTVGNNPRSIKRLMNVLSLIKCITLATNKNAHNDFSLDQRLGKYVNYVVLSLQVQYPKIFHMLQIEPDFKSWTTNIVKRMNVKTLSDEKSEQLKANKESDEPWEQALYAICESDPYLKAKFMDISNLLNKLKEDIEFKSKIESSSTGEKITVGDVMRNAIQITSVTSFSANDDTPVSIDKEDWQKMVTKFHNAVSHSIQKNHSTWRFRVKRNTGNGGFCFTIPGDVDIPFHQCVVGKHPAMEFMSNSEWKYNLEELQDPQTPTRLDYLKHTKIAPAFEKLDKFMGLLLQKYDWIVWESITEFHNVSSNFSRLDIIKPPKVTFKFHDIQRFIDPENIKIITHIIENFVEFDCQINEAFVMINEN